MLASQFWADLERHHPGIDSLDLTPDVAAAWKARLATKTMRSRQPDGTAIEVTSPRSSAPYVLMSIRAFNLDLFQWAVDEPGRWGPWVARCPIKAAEIPTKKLERQQKARMDQRTRDRLPVLPVLVKTADQRLKEATVRLDAVLAAPAGSRFTALGVTYTKARSSTWADPNRTTTVYPEQGKRVDLRMSENRAAGTEPSQHRSVQAADDRRDRSPLADRPVEDGRGADAAGHPGTGGRPQRDRLPGPGQQRCHSPDRELRHDREDVEPADAASLPVVFER